MSIATKNIVTKSRTVHAAARTGARKGPRGEDLAKMPYEMFCSVYKNPTDAEARSMRTASIGFWAAMAAGTVTMLVFSSWI